jgi:hypothetical protein
MATSTSKGSKARARKVGVRMHKETAKMAQYTQRWLQYSRHYSRWVLMLSNESDLIGTIH